jgi:hypothetical protein
MLFFGFNHTWNVLTNASKILHWKQGKVVPVLNLLSTKPVRRTREKVYRSKFSWPLDWLEVNGQIHALVAFSL